MRVVTSLSSDKGILLVLGFAFVVMLAAVIPIFYGVRDAGIIIKDSSIKITGLYGTEIPFDQIKSIEIINELPQMKMRTNGLGTSSTLKGHFLTEGNKNVLLFIKVGYSPIFRIETQSGEFIFLSFKDSKKPDLLKDLQNHLF